MRLEGKSIEVNNKLEMATTEYELLPEPSEDQVEENPNLGEQRTAVILVNFIDNAVEPINNVTVENWVLNNSNPDSIASHLFRNSYGKAWMTGEVYGWYTLESSMMDSCSGTQFVGEIIDVVDQDVYFPDYNRLLMLVANDRYCYFSGMASLGQISISTDDGSVLLSWARVELPNVNPEGPWNFENSIIAIGFHEIGHNFGVMHANDLECGDQVIGTIVDKISGEDPECGECFSYLQNDFFDIMGTTYFRLHFNAYHKEKIGWINNTQILEVNNSGLYSITPLEFNDENESLKVLKIPISTSLLEDEFYYVEFRNSTEYEDVLPGWQQIDQMFDGAMIRINRYYSGGDTQLLDTSPHITDWEDPGSLNEDSAYAVLVEGETFLDEVNHITITTTNVTDDYLEVDIDIPILDVDAGNDLFGVIHRQIEFNASVSNGIPPYNWSWDFGDGNTSILQNPIYCYSTPGIYQAIVTVIDSEDNVGVDIIRVHISDIDSTYVDDDYNIDTPGWGIDHFNNIQDGIAAVTNRGFVYVSNGTYFEDFTIRKPIHLIGEDIYNTIIDCRENGSIIIQADFVTLERFTIRTNNNINVEYSDCTRITDNIITNSFIGIRMKGSNMGVILRNEIKNNDYGILLESSSYNYFSENWR